jgi:hypothetical protein
MAAFTVSGDVASVKSNRHPLSVSVGGVEQRVPAGQAFSVPPNSTQDSFVVNAIASESPARRVAGTITVQKASGGGVPTLDLSAHQPNSLTNVKCDAPYQLSLRKGGQTYGVSAGATVQVGSTEAVTLSMADPAGKVVAECRVNGVTADVGPVEDPFVKDLVHAIDANKPDTGAICNAFRSLAPTTPNAARLQNELVGLLTPISFSAKGAGKGQLRFDNGAPIDALGVPELAVPAGTRTIGFEFAASAQATVDFELLPGQLGNVTCDDPDAAVFASVRGGPRTRVPRGGNVPENALSSPGDQPSDVVLTIEKPAGTVAGTKTVRLHPGMRLPSVPQPLCITYDASEGALRNARVVPVAGGDAIPNVDVYATINGLPRVLLGPVDPPLALPANQTVDLTLTAVARADGTTVAMSRAMFPGSGGGGGPTAKLFCGLRVVEGETLLDLRSESHRVQCSTSSGWSDKSDRGMPQTVRFVAHSRHNATVFMSDASGANVTEIAMQIPLMQSMQAALEYNAETSGNSISCVPLNGGVAVANIDDEPAERSLSTPAMLTGPGPHTALIKLKRVVVNDSQSEMSTQLVAKLRLTMRGGGNSPQHALRALARALRSKPRGRTLSGEPDYDTWLRDIVRDTAATETLPDATSDFKDAVDALADLLLELLHLLRVGDNLLVVAGEIQKLAASQSANTVHFRLRGEQALLVDASPVA